MTLEGRYIAQIEFVEAGSANQGCFVQRHRQGRHFRIGRRAHRLRNRHELVVACDTAGRGTRGALPLLTPRSSAAAHAELLLIYLGSRRRGRAVGATDIDELLQVTRTSVRW
jgi:hypothetical protein